MKKTICLLLIILPLVACNRTANKNEQLMRENDSLLVELSESGMALNEVFDALNNITSNLDKIKTRENIITSAVESAELQKEPVLRISDDINAIDELLNKNRETIARLERSAAQLRKANIKIGALEELIVNMTAQVQSKSDEIVVMKRELDQMQYNVETLTVHVADLTTRVGDLKQDRDSLKKEVSSHSEALNAAYYLVGSRKDLVDRKIVYKSGFIGRTLKANENTTLDNFTQVDVRKFNKLIIGHKNVELVTSHPAESYEIEQTDKGVFESLKITDPKKFWEYSKVLIVSYK